VTVVVRQLTSLVAGHMWFLDDGKQVSEGSGPIKKASNNVAELTAAIKGLEYTKKHFPSVT